MEPVIETVNPDDLDRLPAPEAGDEPDRLDPAALVDLYADLIPQRVLLLRAVVPQLPDSGADLAAALSELGRLGNEVATAGRDESICPSGLVDRLRRLTRRLAQVEELVWSGIYRAVKAAEQRGEVE